MQSASDNDHLAAPSISGCSLLCSMSMADWSKKKKCCKKYKKGKRCKDCPKK